MKSAPKLADLVYNWGSYNFKNRSISVFDTTLRDGLQSAQIKKIPSLTEKFSFLQACSELGIDAVEIGFPVASQSHKQEVIEMAKFVKENKYSVLLSCMARTITADVETIVDVSQKAGIEIIVNILVGSSKIRHLVENWRNEDIKNWIEDCVDIAHKYNLPIEFVTEDTTRSDPITLKYLYLTAINKGVQRIWIADTVGTAVPNSARSITQFFVKNIIGKRKIGLDWHGHDDKGLGVANSLASMEAGADRVQATALGIGERAGNTPMEPILINLVLSQKGKYNLKKLQAYSMAASKMYDVPIRESYPGVGKLVHSTAAGMHAAAILKAKKLDRKDLEGLVYSPFHPEIFGSDIEILIGPMSGIANVEWNFKKLGLKKDVILMEKILNIAKKENKFIRGEEIKKHLDIV